MPQSPDDEPTHKRDVVAEPPLKILGREAPVVRKRFYKAVSVTAAPGGFVVQLDGRDVRTPGKIPLAVTSKPLASAIAAEWAAQIDVIAPATMPLTSLACTAIDAVALKRADVAIEIARYAMSDLLCYRAEGPDGLVQRQSAGWDPVVDWATAELRTPLRKTTGLMPVPQAPDVADAMLAALEPLDSLRLSAMHVLTTLTGSAVLALAVLRRRLSLDEAWQSAHIDEQWQIDRWGTDAEAEARQAARHRTAQAAATVLDFLANELHS